MKISFDLRKGRIGIEGDGPDLLRLIEAAREVMPYVTQMQITAGLDETVDDSRTDGPRRASRPEASPKTMRQFARTLRLGNVAERIAALGYYATKIEGKQSFSPKDLEGWFTMCSFQKPSQMSVSMYDTKRKYGYVENQSRGNWRLSNQGENLVLRMIEECGEE